MVRWRNSTKGTKERGRPPRHNNPVCGNSRGPPRVAYRALGGRRSEQRIATSGYAKRGNNKEKGLAFMGIRDRDKGQERYG